MIFPADDEQVPVKKQQSSALGPACEELCGIVFQKDNKVNQTSLQPVLTGYCKGRKDLRQFHKQTQQMASAVYAAWRCSIREGLHTCNSACQSGHLLQQQLSKKRQAHSRCVCPVPVGKAACAAKLCQSTTVDHLQPAYSTDIDVTP